MGVRESLGAKVGQQSVEITRTQEVEAVYPKDVNALLAASIGLILAPARIGDGLGFLNRVEDSAQAVIVKERPCPPGSGARLYSS
jgi:hypothetical protein